MIAVAIRFIRSVPGLLLLAPLAGVAVAVGSVLLLQGNAVAHLTVLGIVLGALLTALRWRWGVYLVLVYVTIEGAVTNLLYPSEYPLLFKDVLVAVLYASFAYAVLRTRDAGAFPPSVVRPLAVLAAICVVESLNPAGGGLAVALVGMRVLLLYIPLFFVGAQLGLRDAGLERIAWWIFVVSLPVTVFGIWEYVVGPGIVTGFGPGFAQGVFVVGPEATSQSIFRPASTFTFTGHFGAFLLFIAILGVGVVSAPLPTRRRAVAAVVLSMTIIAIVLQAQRTNWVLLPIGVVLLYAIGRHAGGVARGLPVAAAGVLLGTTIGGAVLADRLPVLTQDLSPYSARFASSEAPFVTTLLSPAALTGTGTGTALGAGRHVNGGSVPNTFESGWAIPLSMLGIWGLLALIWLYSSVLRLMWRSRRVLSVERRWLVNAVFVFCLLTVAVSGSINYPPTNVFFWLFAGLASGPAISAQTREHSLRSAPSSAVRPAVAVMA